MEVALRDMGIDTAIISAIHDFLDDADDDFSSSTAGGGGGKHPSWAFLRDAKAMRATPADVVESPDAYEFVVDMPGLKPDQIKVAVEDDAVLVVSGEPRRRRRPGEKEEEGVKYLRMERRMGKMLKKFALPENADREKVAAAYEDGVLTVTVAKSAPPQPKKPKVVEVKIGGGGGGGRKEVGSDKGDWHNNEGSHGEGTKHM